MNEWLQKSSVLTESTKLDAKTFRFLYTMLKLLSNKKSLSRSHTISSVMVHVYNQRMREMRWKTHRFTRRTIKFSAKSKFISAERDGDNIKRIKWDLRFQVEKRLHTTLWMCVCVQSDLRKFLLKALKIYILSTSCTQVNLVSKSVAT